ncbi:hypothetical protein LWI28_006250 [Acer negundo]|uniref:non-specific serine/threonine protein kinase n=1 Tax=Acer negundo TaxID=4023 RepID=A0AAD5IDB7_ACENE|nr:hypothetical protein LWI28_006250 [Acer negundo]
MKTHLFSSSPFLSLVCFLLVVFVKIQSSSSNPYNMYESCKIQFQCGNITAGYPFWGESPRGLPPWEGCGHPELKLNCEHNGDVPTMMINKVNYRVLDIKRKDETLRIARMDYLEPEGICSPAFPNTTINSELFDYSYGPYENVTFLYDCPPSPLQDFPCINSKGTVKYNSWSMKGRDDDRGSMCAASVFFPVPKNSLNRKEIINNHLLLRQVLDKGFELKWKLRGISCENCINSKGSCGSDPVSSETICFCPNQQCGLHHACPAPAPYSSTGHSFDCNDSTRLPDKAPTGSPDSPGEPRQQHCAALQELKLNCIDDDDDLPTMEINGVYYWVLDINLNARTLRITRKDY